MYFNRNKIIKYYYIYYKILVVYIITIFYNFSPSRNQFTISFLQKIEFILHLKSCIFGFWVFFRNTVFYIIRRMKDQIWSAHIDLCLLFLTTHIVAYLVSGLAVHARLSLVTSERRLGLWQSIQFSYLLFSF